MSVQKSSIWHRLYNGETEIRFIPRWKLWFALSGAVLVIGIVSLFTQGLNLGIEFEGGVSWQVPAGHASVDGMRGAVSGTGIKGATVQTVGSGANKKLRIKAELGDVKAADVRAAIAKEADTSVGKVDQQDVSKSWGDQITNKARRALIIFLVLVSLYIAFRFEWKMALATLVALVHDILVTVGIYSVFKFEVTPATVIAILTILGYSIYDGIVVFDRVDENAKALAITGDKTYSTMVNDSMNQVLMRTLNTSITALMPIVSLLVLGSMVLGATTLQDFALALFIGLTSGAYSSIFIASPTLALLKEREERWTNVRKRLETKGSRGEREPEPVGVAAGPAPAEPSTRSSSSSDTLTPRNIPIGGVIQPRGRKKSSRRR